MVLKSFCYCSDLETGTTIIAWLGILAGILPLGLKYTGLARMTDHEVILYLIVLAINGLLLHGVRKERSPMFIPWLVYAIIVIIALVIATVGAIKSNNIGVELALPGGILVLMTYFFLVVYSRYNEINAETVVTTALPEEESKNVMQTGRRLDPTNPNEGATNTT